MLQLRHDIDIEPRSVLLHRVHKDSKKEEETLSDTYPAYSLSFVIDLR